MNISENTLKNIICETINEYYRDYDDNEVYGGFCMATEELIELMPDSELKNRLLSDSDFADEVLSNMAFDYDIELKAYREVSPGDYWTPSDWWLENREIRNDDGLLQNIKAIPNEELRNAFLLAYKALEQGVADGDYDDKFD